MTHKEKPMETLLDPTPATMPPCAEPPTKRQELEAYRTMTVERIADYERTLAAEKRYLAEIEKKIARLGGP